MKKLDDTGYRRLLPGVIVLIAVFGLSGCYTRLAVVDRGYDRVPDYVDEGDYYEGNEGYSDDYYYDENDPVSYTQYFNRFYDPVYSSSYFSCWDYYWCDPWTPYYGSHFSLHVGFGSSWYWGPYDWYGWGPSYGYASYYGYGNPYYYGSPYYGYPYYGSYPDGHYNYVGVAGDYKPRGSTIGRSTLADNSRQLRGGVRGATDGETRTRTEGVSSIGNRSVK